MTLKLYIGLHIEKRKTGRREGAGSGRREHKGEGHSLTGTERRAEKLKKLEGGGGGECAINGE
jgi:hypothetical protein